MKYYNFDVYKLAKETGNTWVVAQTNIAYLSSAELMESLNIQTRLTSFNEKYLIIEAKMFNENKTQLKSVMWSKLAHYNLRTKKSHEHTIELMAFFKEVYYPLEGNQTFEERVLSLKQSTNKM